MSTPCPYCHTVGLHDWNVHHPSGSFVSPELAKLRLHNEALRAALLDLCRMTERQAEDEGLWFIAQTAPEAYLQQELRNLHCAVEKAAFGLRVIFENGVSP